MANQTVRQCRTPYYGWVLSSTGLPTALVRCMRMNRGRRRSQKTGSFRRIVLPPSLISSSLCSTGIGARVEVDTFSLNTTSPGHTLESRRGFRFSVGAAKGRPRAPRPSEPRRSPFPRGGGQVPKGHSFCMVYGHLLSFSFCSSSFPAIAISASVSRGLGRGKCCHNWA